MTNFLSFVSFKTFFSLASTVIVVLLISGFLNIELQQNKVNKIKRYNVEKGIIEYTLSGFTTGHQTVYFDNFGMREATYLVSETKISKDISSKSNTLVLIDGEWVYNVDLDAKTGTKSKNLNYDDLSKYANDISVKDIGEKTTQDMGGVNIGKEDLLGKTCNIWEIKKMNSKVWLYKGITLKNTTNMVGMKMDMVATAFKENAKIPKDKFNIPSDVKITIAPVLKE